MGRYDTLFSPLTIKHPRIRNRLLSTSPAPGDAVGGHIMERYRSYQAEKARGGVGLTPVRGRHLGVGGHEVVLFEATGKLGGQILLAARATWRRGQA